MGRANSYVAGSRHKDNSHFFINSNEIRQLNFDSNIPISDLEKLGRLMSRSNKSSLAVDQLISKQVNNQLKEQSICEAYCAL